MRKLIASSLVLLLVLATDAAAQTASRTQSQTDRSSGQSATTSDATDSPSADRNSSSSATEQSSTSGARRNSLGATGQSTASQGMLQQHLATCLALGNEEEVAMAQFAEQRAQNPQVKQFAQMMIQEHQQALQQLHQAAPQLASMNLKLRTGQSGQSGAASPQGETSNSSSSAGSNDSAATAGADRSATAGAENATETASTGAATTGNQRGASAGGQGHQLAEFAHEVKQNCLHLTEQALAKKQGAEFDKAYIGIQIVAHTNMLAELQTAQRYTQGSPLQSIVQQGTQMTEHHLSQAKSIMQQLDAESAQGGAQAQNTSATQSR
jgi:predicted outer membrane protein